MSFIKTDDVQKGKNTKIYYEDYGSGQPVILIHGWPLSSHMWEYQIEALVEAGYRAIAYDRRGFGKSDRPWNGYDYDTLAADLRALILDLNLNDCILVGFSMGGGEVARYFSRYGSDRIAKAVLVSSIVPIVKETQNNPDGVPQEDFDNIMNNLKKDRVAFLAEFGQNFYNYNDNLIKLSQNKVSDRLLHFDWNVMAHASPRATRQTAHAWYETDFRDEAKKISVPTLIIHGDADNVVPIATAGEQAAKLIPNNQYRVIKDAPHGLVTTHTDKFNDILIEFVKEPKMVVS